MGTHQKHLIQVEQKHIDRSTREHSGKCMIAEAITDAIPGARRVHVDLQTIRYTDDKDIRRTFLTGAVPQSALVRYDAGDEVRPFVFRLPSPMHISRPTVRSEASKHLVKSESPSRRGAGALIRPRIGGRGVPILGNATRRRFGIRNLRINQQGEVVQLGTEQVVHASTD